VAARLVEALGKAGIFDEQAEVLRGRIRAAKRRDASKAELAQMHVDLGLVEARLGENEAAERTLEKALELAPDDPRALAELARLRQGGADWDGYAKAREREAEVAASPAQAVAALIDAARVLTFLAKARAHELQLEPRGDGADEIGSIYRTASNLALHGRRLVAEADTLLATVRGEDLSQPAGDDEDDLEVLRCLLAATMDDALTAIGMLESIQELGAEELQLGPLDTPSARANRQVVEELLARLRR
jgi:tetratricopeptide (TPR) repeat protein